MLFGFDGLEQGALLVSSSSTILPRFARTRSSSSALFAIRCENKYYQLEEMEDRENSTTELFLKADGTVLIGDTDGPLWLSAEGTWHVPAGTDDFTMTIRKTFGTGSKAQDMGECSFQVERKYIGDLTEVGESVAITGVMKAPSLDEDGNKDEESYKEVGFFNMIDGTNVREDRRSDTAITGKQGEDVLQKRNDATATHKGRVFTSPIQVQENGQSPSETAQPQPAQSATYEQQTQPAFSYGIEQQQQQQQEQEPAAVAQEQSTAVAAAATTTMQPQQDEQQQPQEEDVLPAGWEAYYDENYKMYYYYNTATDTAQWEKPVAAAATAQQQTQKQQSVAAATRLPKNWEEHYDPEDQRPFYYNTVTGVSQWERPMH
ncbi:hypothetical protein ACA910_010143 [Epithemia clementina (nom. ined.)]